MRIGLVEIKDECANCGEILQCELCKQGHGIGTERINVTHMIACQLKHKEKRSKEKNE